MWALRACGGVAGLGGSGAYATWRSAAAETGAGSPEAFSWLAARHLVCTDRKRQALLEAPGPVARLHLMLRALRPGAAAAAAIVDHEAGPAAAAAAAAAAMLPHTAERGALPVLQCRHCSARVAPVPDSAIPAPTLFANPAGQLFRLLILSCPSGDQDALAVDVGPGGPCRRSSFFPGFAWSCASCAACDAHLGWRFDDVASLPDSLVERMVFDYIFDDAGDVSRSGWLVDMRRWSEGDVEEAEEDGPPNAAFLEDVAHNPGGEPLKKPFYALISNAVEVRVRP